MIDNELLRQVKEVSLPMLLAERGIRPDNNRDPHADAKSFPYRAIYRNESNPSLCVFRGRSGQWLYKDHATGEYGTNLDLLVRMGFYRDWREAAIDIAARYLGSGASPIMTAGMSSDAESETQHRYRGEVISVSSIEGSPVERYIEHTRMIPIVIARCYISYVRYTYDGSKVYYGIGWQTIKGSWAIRWPIEGGRKGKCFIGPLSLSSFLRSQDSFTMECAVFEGVFDFLSFVTLNNDHVWDAFVLNSVENAKAVIPELAKYEIINCYLDNDDAGRKATSKIRDVYHDKVVDHASSYRDNNDLNEYLKANHNKYMR